MAQQQFNVNLTFTANTQQAKAQMRDLQKTFNNLSANLNQQISLKGLTTELKQGYEAAKNLQSAIQSATNMDTGKLDLTKFNRSLTNSGKSLKAYAEDLSALGPEGKMAFSQMASAISSAEVPLRKTNMLVDKLWNSLKNVATWQISSSLLQGFTGAISDAYKYAHDLNGSLNDIRIVTGQNIDQMAKFAKQANETAKVLSTTTKEYAKASLIYFQQGLTDAEVQKRTDITIKMANVTGTSAQQVSDQMTAVWNNFYDGSKSLEYYADVMTALGAATASSTDEISEGLNKFAAVAETVGLSYEYAASALATLTSETRESADIVGNALKTLFARIQGLQLGETLEDGVTLNKYSEALAKVGINVLDTNGNLKKMDAILNEMGAKWDTLGKAEQVALAQTVAGVRQYNQLISLMDNWDKFQTNLNTATGSSGALQKQADIYAESWEAAEKRVKASAEAIYQKLLNDEFFIDLTNLFADLLDIIKGIIDSLGGLPGLLGLMGTAVTKFAGDKILSSLNSVMDQFSASSKRARQEALETKQTAAKLASDIALGDASQEMAVRSDMIARENKLKLEIFNIDRDLTEFEQEKLAQITEQAKVLDDLLLFQAQIADEKQREVEAAQKAKELAQQELDIVKKTSQEIGGRFDAQTIIIAQKAASTNIPGLTKETAQVTLSSFEERLARAYNGQGSLSNEIKNVSVELNEQLTEWGLSAEEIEKYTQNLIETVKIKQEVIDKTDQKTKAQEKETKALEQASRAQTQVTETSKEQIKIYEKAEAQVLALKNAQSTVGTIFMDTVQTVSSFATALSSLSSIIDIWNDESLSGWEKFSRILTSLGFALPMLIKGWKSMKSVLTTNTAVKIANALATMGQAKAEDVLQKEKSQSNIKIKQDTNEINKNTLSKILNKGKSKVSNFGTSIKDSWNQGALQNNPKYTQTKTGSYSVKGVKGFVSADKAASMAGKEALAGLGSSLLAIGAAVAIVAASYAVFKTADEYLNKDKIAAEEAAASAERLAETHEEASAKYDELKNSIASYEDNLTGLAQLEKGTLEYRDAVSAANEQALKLIDTYDELAGQYYTTTDGLIVFNEEALQNVQLLELQKKNAAQAALAMARQEARITQTQSNRTDFARNSLEGNENGISGEDWATFGQGSAIGAGAGAIGGLAVGMTVGSVIPVVGTLIGAAAGLVAGAIGGVIAAAVEEESTQEEQRALDAIYELYDKVGDAALTPENISKALQAKGITDPDLINSLNANRDELGKLMAEMKANTEALKAETKTLVASQINTIDSNFTGLNEDSQSAITSVLADRELHLQKTLDYKQEDYRSDVLWWHSSTSAGDAAFEAWAKDQGIDPSGVNFGDKTISYKVYDKEQQKTVEKELHYSDLAAWQEGKAISEDIAKNYEVIKINLMTIAEMDYGDGVLNALAEGNLNNLSQKEFEAFKLAYENGEFNEELKSLGELTGENYALAVAEAINNYDPEEALAEYTKKINNKISGILSESAAELGVSEGALENYADALMKSSDALSSYGDEWEKLDNKVVAAELAVANAKFAKGVEQLNEVLFDNIEILKEWNEGSLETWEAVSKVQDALENVFGVRVSADYVKKNLADLQRLANGNVESLEELRQEAAKDYILNLDISSSAKNSLLNGFYTLLNEVEGKDIEIGATLDDTDYINKLNEMLKAGDITAEQVQNAFGALGYSVDIRTTKRQIENTTYVQGSLGGQDFSGSYTTYTTMDVPYIAGEGTADSIGVESKVDGDPAHFEQKESGSGFTYRGGASTAGAALSGFSNKAAKNVKTVELEDEIDRYHQIKELISDITRELDALGKAKDRAYGANKIALIQEEINKTKQLLAAQEAYVAEINTNFNNDRNTLLGFGASTDSQGRITNYEALRTNWANWYNQSMANVVGDEEAEQQVQDKYNAFTEAIDQYEESLNLLEEEQQEVIDLQNQIFDLELAKIEYEVESKIEIADDEIKWLEYQLEHIEDSAWNAADAIAKIGDIAGQNIEKVKAYQEGLTEVFGLSLNENELAKLKEGDFSVLNGKALTEGQVEALKNYRDALYESNEALEEFYKRIEEQSTAAFEGMNEEMDKQIARVDHLTSVLETYANIIDLVGKKNLGLSTESIRELGRAQVEAAKSALATSKTQLDTNRAQLKEAQRQKQLILDAQKQTLAEGGEINEEADAKAIEYWDNLIETISDKVTELEATVNEQWVNALQAAADDFERAVDTVMEAFEDSMSGIYGSFDDMEQAYSQQKEISERYLSDYEQIYNLSKLNRDITKSINENDSIKAKSRLRDLQEEINVLQESNTEMTQYEVDELRARYELHLAEIALEDAQNAKSQVRMQRDAEGNWSYIYTADQSNIDAAMQTYEDKLFAYQNLTQDYISEMEDQIINLPREYADKMREIASDMNLTEEERKTKMEELTAFYSEKYKYLYDELGKALGNSQLLYEQDWQSYSQHTGYKIALDSGPGGWRDTFNETALAQITGYTNIDTARSLFDSHTKQTLIELTGAFEVWKIDVSTIMDEMGVKLNGDDETSFKSVMEKTVSNTTTELGEIESAMAGLSGKATTAFAAMTKAVATEFTAYSAEIEKYKTANAGLINQINWILQNQSQIETGGGTNDNPPPTDYTHEGTDGTEITPVTPEFGPTPEPEETEPEEDPQAGRIKGFFSSESARVGQGAGDTLNFELLKGNMSNFTSRGDYAAFEYGGRMWYITNEDAKRITEILGYQPEQYRAPSAKTEPVDNTEYLRAVNDLGETETPMSIQLDFAGPDSPYPNWMYTQIQDGKFKVESKNPDGRSYYGYFVNDPYLKDRLVHAASVNLQKYDTGGYTGSWGSDGRLAMLHQKEIVLNADDTAKFLSAIEIVRDISRIIDLRAAAQQTALGRLVNYTMPTPNQILEQQVTIHAEFPNATQRGEIEAAFDTLINRASQFANRKN